MSITIIFIFLLLSSVVVITDSCSSFSGWKSRHIDVMDEKNMYEKIEMTTESNALDHSKNNNNNNNSIDSSSKHFYNVHVSNKQTLILPMHATYKRCEETFGKKFCNGNGICFSIDYHNGEDVKAQCICHDDQLAGDNCLQKTAILSKDTVVGRADLSKEIPETSTTSTTTVKPAKITTVHNLVDVMNFGKSVACPSPWSEDLCINGECYMLPSLSTVDLFCNCHQGFIGTRCTLKSADFQYDMIPSIRTRPRRNISAAKRRAYRLRPKSRAAKT